MSDPSPVDRAAGTGPDVALAELRESDVKSDPFAQFADWLGQAAVAGADEPTAMTLATATCDGRPSARVVLLKGFDERGFVFYTNYESRKGRDLAENPRAALLFHWAGLGRQVRLTGPVGRASREKSARYFQSRAVGSRLGALASRQSTVIASREELARGVARRGGEYGGQETPLPPYGGGSRLAPESFEFWQSRPNRLHDRL